MNSQKISLPRAIGGFTAGTVFVLAVFCWLLWPVWSAVLAVGGVSAVVVLAVFGFPAFLLLRSKGMLSVYAAAILGGIFCALPPALLAFNNWIEGLVSYSASDFSTLLVYFVLPGAIGGVIGWLTAAGWRTRAA